MAGALAELRDVYAAREAAVARRRAAGARVVGYVGPDVPRELIAAAGLLPVRIRVRPGVTGGLGDRLLGTGVDDRVRALASQLCGDDPGPYDVLVLSHEDEPTVRLYASLRELVRAEPERRLPELHFLDLLHLPAATTEAYDLDSLRLFAATLARWSGRPLEDEAMRVAIAEQNETRRLLGRLRELRRAPAPRLAGSDALAAIGAGTALPAVEHAELLRLLLAEAAELPLRSPRSRVYLTGSDHEVPDVYEALESLGAHVVGEDHDWGERSHDGLVDETVAEPLAALAARYHHGSATGRRHGTAERAAYTAAQARAAGADVVLAWIRAEDDAHAWDVPAQRELLAAHGLPLVVLRHRPFRAGDAEAVAAELEPALAAAAAT